MTIIPEYIGTHPNGQRLVQRRSDRGVMLHKIGTDEYYPNPIDVEYAPWSYEETDIPVPPEEEEVTPTDSTD